MPCGIFSSITNMAAKPQAGGIKREMLRRRNTPNPTGD